MIIGSAMIFLLGLGIAAVAGRRLAAIHMFVNACCCAVTLVLTTDAATYLMGAAQGHIPTAVLPFGLPWMSAHFRLDSLSAFFLMAINIPAALASLYAIGYSHHLPDPGRVTPLFPLFLFGMNGVLVADDAFVFLVAWEFMSLSSWLLVLSDHKSDQARHAASVYLIMAAFGTFCLLAAFGLMAGTGGTYDFATIRAHHAAGTAAAAVVLLALLGAGSKAGLVPLHAWLPLAHPAAPSHVSALMSGVMTKVALYGLIRILFDLCPAVGWEWGFVMMVAGGLTAVLGIFYALMQRDLKTLLAYSTVENIGVVVIALGLAAAFRDHGETELAALALVAALYHILNHSLFKSLLFMGAGAVIAATGQRDLDKLGGLFNRMPVTGLCFLVGACAISALPPLNGFVSEWLVFQALFHGPTVAHWAMRFGVPVVGVMMALAAAFAASCFVRAFGVAFLGRPRTDAARIAEDAPLTMQVAMALPALFCLVLGIFPVMVSTGIASVVEPLIKVKLPSAILGWPWLSPVSATAGSYSATMVMLTGIALAITTILVVHHFGTRKLRRAPAWDCGHPEELPNAQYSADSFSQPARRVFGATVFSARETVEMPPPGDISPARFSVRMVDPVWDGLYQGIIRTVQWLADRVDRLQFLTVRQYLLMMFWTLVLLLLVVALRSSS
jgi:formate hydrogenlyase subunit 3/multisubunit Na+/H+ antiporter MnhD subunit